MTARTCLAALAAAAGALALSGCAQEAETAAAVRAPAVQVAGEPVSCVTTSQIRDTDVHDDFTIDFEMQNGTVYRNTLPGRCPGLGFEERFAYRTSIGRLCSSDTITVLQSSGRNSATCGLGQFVPVRYVEEAGSAD